MIEAPAHAKINLALAVGSTRADGLHEVATILQRVELHDTIALEPGPALSVEGFDSDTIVRSALEALAAAAGVEPNWRVRIEKRIPLAAGLGGGSSDAATALRLASELLAEPLSPTRLHELARAIGADVPFFLTPGPKLGTGAGTTLEPLDLPQDYTALLLLPDGETKPSTREVYLAYDGAEAFDERKAAVLEIAGAGRAADLKALPPNDLARSPLAARLFEFGAFRADVTGAGPTVYALFSEAEAAERAAASVSSLGRTWITRPAW